MKQAQEKKKHKRWWIALASVLGIGIIISATTGSIYYSNHHSTTTTSTNSNAKNLSNSSTQNTIPNQNISYIVSAGTNIYASELNFLLDNVSDYQNQSNITTYQIVVNNPHHYQIKPTFALISNKSEAQEWVNEALNKYIASPYLTYTTTTDANDSNLSILTLQWNSVYDSESGGYQEPLSILASLITTRENLGFGVWKGFNCSFQVNVNLDDNNKTITTLPHTYNLVIENTLPQLSSSAINGAFDSSTNKISLTDFNDISLQNLISPAYNTNIVFEKVLYWTITIPTDNTTSDSYFYTSSTSISSTTLTDWLNQMYKTDGLIIPTSNVYLSPTLLYSYYGNQVIVNANSVASFNDSSSLTCSINIQNN